MASLVKIRGLTRNSNAIASGLAGGNQLPQGFRIPSGLGQQSPSGVAAWETVGTVGAPNAAVTYTAKYNGAWGYNVKVVHAAPSGSTTTIVPTFASTTGIITITVTPATAATAAQVATAVNADAFASQFVTATLPGTGASAAVASADANAVLALSAGTGTVSAGTFTLTFPGYGTTTTLNFGDSTATMAAAIQVAIRLNANHASATVTGGGTALPTGPATFTFGATGGTNTPFPVPTFNWLTGPTGGTYVAAYTTWGRAAAGTLAGGVDGTGALQPVFVLVNSKVTAIVDADDAQTQRILKRKAFAYISLGQA